MSDKLFGLAGLGLDNLENMDIYGQGEKGRKGGSRSPKNRRKGSDL